MNKSQYDERWEGLVRAEYQMSFPQEKSRPVAAYMFRRRSRSNESWLLSGPGFAL
jgi:hypothetical protein